MLFKMFKFLCCSCCSRCSSCWIWRLCFYLHTLLKVRPQEGVGQQEQLGVDVPARQPCTLYPGLCQGQNSKVKKQHILWKHTFPAAAAELPCPATSQCAGSAASAASFHKVSKIPATIRSLLPKIFQLWLCWLCEFLCKSAER